MNLQPLVSIICPVYNTSKYLEQCIKSVINQNYNNFEFLLIDDASRDNSLEICNDFAGRDKRIKVLPLSENIGLAGVRNKGLEEAKGKYIIYIDCDDFWVGDEGLNFFVSTLENNPHYDFLIFNIYYYNQIDDKLKKDHSFKKIELREYANKFDKIIEFSSIKPMSIGSWSRIVKREFLNKHSIRFKNIVLEDMEWNKNLFEYCSDFGVIDLYFYAYRKQNPEATTSKFRKERFCGLFETVKDISNENRSKTSELSEVWLSCMALQLFVVIVGVYNLKKPDRDSMFKEINKYLWVLRYGNTMKIKITQLMCSFFGVELCSYIFFTYMYYKLK